MQVTGEALYTDDVPLPPNTLHAALVKSIRPHAKINSVDPSAALQVRIPASPSGPALPCCTALQSNLFVRPALCTCLVNRMSVPQCLREGLLASRCRFCGGCGVSLLI